MHYQNTDITRVTEEMFKVFDYVIPRALAHPNKCTKSISIEETRNGRAAVLLEPLTITYTNPRRRVLFNDTRNTNPFFHLIESIWMLAGCNTVDPLHHFCSKIREFSDTYMVNVPSNGDMSTQPVRTTDDFHGAYGHRWSHHFMRVSEADGYLHTIDQVHRCILHLRDKPHSRRAVIQMWDPSTDLDIDSLDLPCNLVAIPQLKTRPTTRDDVDWIPTYSDALQVTGEYGDDTTTVTPDPITFTEGPLIQLDLTVYNRSNDLVWGMLGANPVHFSMLQEYMAIALGVQVGHLHQVSTNAHVYEHHWDKLASMAADATVNPYISPRKMSGGSPSSTGDYSQDPASPGPTYTDPDSPGTSAPPTEDDTVPIVPLYGALYQADTIAFIFRCHNFIDWVSTLFDPEEAWNKYAKVQGMVAPNPPKLTSDEFPFLSKLCYHAALAFWHHKHREYTLAHAHLRRMPPSDWRSDMTRWITARQSAYKTRQTTN